MVYWTFSLNFKSCLTLRFNRHCYAWSLGQTQLQCHYQSNYWRYFWSKKMSHAIFCLTLSSPADKHLPDLLVLFFLLNHFSIWFTEQSPNSAQIDIVLAKRNILVLVLVENTLKSSVQVTWFLKSVMACPGQHHVTQQFRAFKTWMMQVKHKHKPG